MTGGGSLLVSIPGAQLAPLALPGAIFAWRHLRDAPLDPDLRLALRLVMHTTAGARVRVRFLARPEIYTHGAARAWLDERLGDTREHLILTDGDTLRCLPGLRNHMFFYARGQAKREAALRRLVGLAPELFAGLASQVNGSLSFRLGARWISPPLQALRFAATPELEAAATAPFLCHPGHPDRCAEHAADEAAERAPDAAGPLHFVPLTAGALADASFAAWLARQVQAAASGGAG
ncbi:hypothetical protein, partial [Falsiroseomonas oryzae]|uniref:hypothetical protein n=1 Tax=Falsiroseomonas oryzae TaxID=2766473 RepID=UPI0022EA75A7